MRSEELLAKLSGGERVYGTLVISTSPKWPQMVQSADLDFVFLDLERMPMQREQLSWMCQTFKAMAIAPLVRIPSPNPYDATIALDGGASGIIAPYVENADQVRALSAAVKLRPLRGTKAKNIATGEESVAEPLKSYLEKYNREHVLVVMIESQPGIDNLAEILAVPQLDAILIGPHDLSCSLGVPEDYDSPVFRNAVDHIIRKGREAGVAVGIHWFWDMGPVIEWAEKGLNMIVHASDMTLFTAKLTTDLAYIKNNLGDEVVTQKAQKETSIRI